MSDITDLFTSVAPEPVAPTPDMVEADIARGRTAMVRAHRQRTMRRSAAVSGALVVVAAAAVGATQLGDTSNPKQSATKPPVSSAPVHTGHAHHAATSIKLVAYTGDQLDGFTVDRIPDGWHLSSSSQTALLIDAAGDSNNNPDDFEGKLAVLTSSSDQHGLGSGDKVTVNGEPGVVSDQGSYGIMLRYNSPDGFGVNIQAPAQLHWSDEQIVRFAEGVHVTGNAVHTRG